MTCLSKEKLKNYLNPILVETGTYIGDGVQVAKDAGFERIFSIEASKILCAKSSQRFQSDITISIIYGDSSKVLWSVIKNIEEKITFVLDAHNLCYGEDTKENNKGLEWWPLKKELEIITKHSRKDHTIIIDDVKLFENPFKTSMTEIMTLLYKINPNYQYHLIEGIFNGKVIDDSILIAEVKDKV